MYDTPRHPWQKARIDEEKTITYEFGLKNKKEIQRHTTFIKTLITHFKRLSYQETAQAEIEKDQLQAKVVALGLIKADDPLSAILDLKVQDILARRLQTVIVKRKLARSTKQARQFITHKHIVVNNQIIDSPSFLVPKASESAISFVVKSPLFQEDHPERHLEQKVAELKPADAPAKEPVKAEVKAAPVVEEKVVEAVEIKADAAEVEAEVKKVEAKPVVEAAKLEEVEAKPVAEPAKPVVEEPKK